MTENEATPATPNPTAVPKQTGGRRAPDQRPAPPRVNEAFKLLPVPGPAGKTIQDVAWTTVFAE